MSTAGRRALTALLVLLLGVTSITSAPPAQAEAPRSYYVESTGHLLADPFLSYWLDNNGIETLGFPVTEPLHRLGRVTQYFEFGALFLTNSGEVARIKVGRNLLRRLHGPDEFVKNRRVGSDRNPTGFSYPRAIESIETEPVTSSTYRVSGSIRSFYERNGGEDRFGKPLSNAYSVMGERVQWFEYGRIEAARTRPSVAPIGLELAKTLGLPTAPGQRGDLPIFDPERLRTYTGDGTIPEASGPFDPTTILIPKIQVTAAVEPVPITNGVMGTPQNAWNVGWYPAVSHPGEWTNVVLAGHRDWWNLGPVVFWNLDQLTIGDRIYLAGADGAGFTYSVYDIYRVPWNVDANTLVEDTGRESVTLITCIGVFNGSEYQERLIVRAERI